MMFKTVILLEEPAHLLLVLLECSPKQFPGRDEELGPSRAITHQQFTCSQLCYEG